MADTLPLRRMVLYKHGVGYFTRTGIASADEISLPLRTAEVDDVLKSLVAVVRNGGQIRGVRYETVDGDRLADIPFSLAADHSLFDLLRSLRGSATRVQTNGSDVIDGIVIGLEEHPQGREFGATLTLLTDGSSVRQVHTDQIMKLELDDERMSRDLAYYLERSRSEENQRTIRLDISEPGGEIEVSYTAPSPIWRVSYRLVGETAEDGKRRALLQAWGIFDNQFEEDLDGVDVTLAAGQPISFRYDLTSSVVPERSRVEDEARVVSGPIEFDAALKEAPRPAAPVAMARMARAAPAASTMPQPFLPAAGTDDLIQSTEITSQGRQLDELYEYELGPVSVKRGESAMAPIVQHVGDYARELLYNSAKTFLHPVVAIRIRNETGLTLERGPVVIVEDGEYRGEAILPYTGIDGEIVVAFAVELGIRVLQESRVEIATAGLRLEGGLVHIEQHETHTTLYTLRNATAQEQVVTIEREQSMDELLVDTREADEEAGVFRRWRVPCPPMGMTTFTVKERRRTYQRQELYNQDLSQLTAYLHERFLDAETRARLETILRYRQALAELERREAGLRAERQEFVARREQLRMDLSIQATNAAEAEIRQRSAAAFKRAQDREEAIDDELERVARERDDTQQQLRAELGRLAAEDGGEASVPLSPSPATH